MDDDWIQLETINGEECPAVAMLGYSEYRSPLKKSRMRRWFSGHFVFPPSKTPDYVSWAAKARV